MASDTTIPTASVLGISIALLATSWRSYFADQLRQLNVEWTKDKVIAGVVTLLLTTLVVHIIWLISSVTLLILGQKGSKLVMWGWIAVTWLSIVTDTAFFYYVHYHLLTINYTSMLKVDISVMSMSAYGTAVSCMHLGLLLVHIIMAYLTVQVGCYALKSGVTRPVTMQGQVFGPVQPNAYMTEGQPVVGNQVYQNATYSRSAEDLSYAPGNYIDKPFLKYKRYAAPEDIPPADYDRRRGSRQIYEGGRY